MLAKRYVHHGAVAQLGERRVRNAKVGSSILLGSTNSLPPIAQRHRGLYRVCVISTFGKKETNAIIAAAIAARIMKKAPNPHVVCVQAIIGIAVALTEKVMM